MPIFNFFTATQLKSIVHKRKGECKFGEKVKLITNPKDYSTELKNTDVNFVLLGIPESIGVKANKGIPGTETTYASVLSKLLNTQNNTFNKAKKILVLGHLDCTKEMQLAKKLDTSNPKDLNTLYDLVSVIDKEVTNIIHNIVAAGKIPIVIGGGHNNAYGNIKGTSLALNQPIHVINFDAHTDFRTLEGRHSGNGFSYAFDEGFLQQYFIFGLHENYTSKNILKTLQKLNKRIAYNTFEAIAVRQETDFMSELKTAKSFLKGAPLGIEVDLDAVQNIASSAMTPSGFSATQTRQFIHYFSKHKKVAYLHICEGATVLESNQGNQTAKFISYLITDFIRG